MREPKRPPFTLRDAVNTANLDAKQFILVADNEDEGGSIGMYLQGDVSMLFDMVMGVMVKFDVAERIEIVRQILQTVPAAELAKDVIAHLEQVVEPDKEKKVH